MLFKLSAPRSVAARALSLTATLAATGGVALAGGDEKSFDVMVGDPAPPLRVAEWVRGEPVASFDAAQTYVVEFWATWCGPCKKAIPHMSELQDQYGDDVRFIGVSVWENDPAKVTPFVERMGEKMAYTVASDRAAESDEPYMAEEWMKAAGQEGIPTAFIIDRGRVAWIGSPFTIDEPLAQVAAGTWDLAAATEKHAAEMRVPALARDLRTELEAATKERRWADAAMAVGAAVRNEPALEMQFGLDRFLFLTKAGKSAEASKYGRHLVANVYDGNAGRLNYLAWTLVDPKGDVEDPDLELALQAAKRGNELTEWKDPAVLDTYALALYLSGDRAKAIQIQEKAVEHAIGTPYEEELEERLEEFKATVGAQG